MSRSNSGCGCAMNTHARTREPHAQYILATKTAWQARAVAGLEARSRHALGVSASPRSRVTVRESGSGLPCHGSDGALLPAATAERCEAGGAAAAADVRCCRAELSCRRELARQLEGGVGDRRAGSLSSADAASRLGGGSCFAARMWRGDVRASAVRLLCGSSIERTRWLSQAESTYIYIYQVRRKETASQARDGQNRKAHEGQRKKTKTITNAKLTTARHRATAMPSCVDGLYDARRQINIVEALALKNS